MITETQRLNAHVRSNGLTDLQFLAAEITRWENSKERKMQVTGERYYLGQHDILNRQRTVIGEDGNLHEVSWLPNNRIIDNQYGKMVDQKVNYLLGKPLTFESKSKAYVDALNDLFNQGFHRTLQNVGEDSMNGGVAWLHPYFDEKGKLAFKKFSPYECLPLWSDSEHTKLEALVRVYEVDAYEGNEQVVIERVDVYALDGVSRYERKNGELIPDKDIPFSHYVSLADSDTTLNWGRIPIIAFKRDDKETPLIIKVKSLQDTINAMISDFANNMQEDSRNTILVLINYDGEDLGEFRHNLATYGAVKVRSDGPGGGGVQTLQVEVNAKNYEVILQILKNALIENAMGYDAKDDRTKGTPNQMNILSMYCDIDLDANGMETEYQASLQELLWFVNAYLANAGVGDFEQESVRIIFNRDLLMNEAETMGWLISSGVQISNETLLAQVPFVNDVKRELGLLRAQREAATDPYGTDAFPKFQEAQKKGAASGDSV